MRNNHFAAAILAGISPTAVAQYCPTGPDFDPPIFIATGPDAGDFSLGDFNNDDILDLAVVNEGNGTVATFLGNGDGTFTPDQNVFTGFDAGIVAIVPYADSLTLFDSLLIGHSNNDTLTELPRTAGGTFGPGEICFVEGTAADIKLDSILSTTIDTMFVVDDPAGPDALWYRLNSLPPSFDFCDAFDSGKIATANGPTAIDTADLDGDGATETILVAGRTNGVVFTHNTNDGFLAVSYPVGPEPTALAVGDVDEDGFDDIAVAFGGLDAVRVFLGDGLGGLSLSPIELPYTVIFNNDPTGITIADFNHDDELDIVLATNSNPGLLYFRGNGTGFFSAPISLSGQFDHTALAADLNGDGVNDLISSTPAASGPADGVKVYLSNCTLCPADTNGDGVVDPADFTAWIIAFNDDLPQCDQNGDGECDAADFTAWVLNYNDGC